MLDWINLMFWNKYKVICNHNLGGLKSLKVSRSSGAINTDCEIKIDTAMRLSKTYEEFI